MTTVTGKLSECHLRKHTLSIPSKDKNASISYHLKSLKYTSTYIFRFLFQSISKNLSLADGFNHFEKIWVKLIISAGRGVNIKKYSKPPPRLSGKNGHPLLICSSRYTPAIQGTNFQTSPRTRRIHERYIYPRFIIKYRSHGWRWAQAYCKTKGNP